MTFTERLGKITIEVSLYILLFGGIGSLFYYGWTCVEKNTNEWHEKQNEIRKENNRKVVERNERIREEGKQMALKKMPAEYCPYKNNQDYFHWQSGYNDGAWQLLKTEEISK